MTQPLTPTVSASLHRYPAGRATRQAVTFAVLLLSAAAASAQFNISTGSGIFAPSFRDTESPFDGGDTTWFGWSPGSLDGTPDNELIDNPAVTIGIGGLDGALNQVGTVDALSSSNSIYTFPAPGISLTLDVPTVGSTGTGFTTIIVQGAAAFGGIPEGGIVFPALNGVEPDFVLGTNSAGQGQFWAKYELLGNAASYTLGMDIVKQHVSLGTIVVDTQWSSTSFAPETAQAVPEPAAFLSLAGGAGLLGMLRRRRTHNG